MVSMVLSSPAASASLASNVLWFDAWAAFAILAIAVAASALVLAASAAARACAEHPLERRDGGCEPRPDARSVLVAGDALPPA